MDYSLPQDLKQVQAGLDGYLNKLVDLMEKALNADAPLEVSTYTSQDMEGVHYAAERFSGARLRLQTRIDINGDAQLVLPQEKDEVDPALWNYHMELVRQAQASRLELLKTLVAAATGLADLIKPAA